MASDILYSTQNKEETFKRLFESFYPALCVFANKYLQDSDVSADLAQDAFLSLWKIRKDISSDKSAKSYLFKTIKNKCLNYLRNQKNREIIQNEHPLTEDIFFRDNLIETETYQIIHNAINTLPLQTKKIIELSLDGLKNNDIATTLNISVNTVKTLKLRAFKILRDKLDKKILLFLLIHCL